VWDESAPIAFTALALRSVAGLEPGLETRYNEQIKNKSSRGRVGFWLPDWLEGSHRQQGSTGSREIDATGSSRSFAVAGPRGSPESIVRPGPLTKPGSLRRGNAEPKSLAMVSPFHPAAYTVPGTPRRVGSKACPSAGWLPVRCGFVGASRKAPGGRCENSALGQAIELPKGTKYARREPLS
jgi:hypothetical protein